MHTCLRHVVRLFRAEPGAKRPVLGPHAVRKHPLEGLQRVAAHRVEPFDFRHAQGLCPVHVVHVQVRVEGPNDGPERVADPVAQVPTISGPEPEAARRPAPPSHGVLSKVGPGLTALRE